MKQESENEFTLEENEGVWITVRGVSIQITERRVAFYQVGIEDADPISEVLLDEIIGEFDAEEQVCQ